MTSPAAATPSFDHPLDPQVRPQDDLFGHVNNSWLASAEIPADRGRYGVFDLLRERAEEDVRTLVEECAEGTGPGTQVPGSPAAKIADLYASFMDEARVDELGAAPLRPLLAQVDAIATPSDLARTVAALGRDGVGGFVHPYVDTDKRASDRYVLYLHQGGLGLPDESYYRGDTHAAVREAYPAHVARMLEIGGAVAEGEGAAAAERVMALETRLAEAHWDRVANRDAVKTYTLMTRDELQEASPGLDWAAYAEGLAGPEGVLDEVVVRQPSFLADLAHAVTDVDLADWHDWLRWHVVHAFAPYLHGAAVAENFDFYGRTLSGIPQLRERWKRGVALVEEALGEAVGELYVARHFPPAARQRMSELVDNVIEAFRRSFTDLAWMSPETRAAALAKLEAFRPKIGHPPRWRDYSTLQVRADDLLGNVRRASSFELDRNLAKLGGPIDRDEWFLTPQTVNAYYHPGLHEIVFPAAILQPPFFDADAGDAENYGGIGAVIGHEIGHGFDDAGSTYDGSGNLHDWWTAEDRERFEERAQRLKDQFDVLESRSAPGRTVNGALTVGENIGDLGGLAIGHAAYRIANEGDEPADASGLTGDQRFFVSWARVWCGTAREEEAVRLLAIDPHAPGDLRGNAVRNVDAFHEAFGVSEGDGMWVAPEERVSIF